MAAAFLPRIYPILDIATLQRISGDGDEVAFAERAAGAFFAAGVKILQLRAKDFAPQPLLKLAAAIKRARDAAASKCILILNDRPDLALLAGYDGCHLGQQDLSVGDENGGARRILPRPKIIGLSTHNAAQIELANVSHADYLAIGPIFSTATKLNPEPVVGLEALSRLRALTSKPLVAIGGITRANCRSVLDAGADSVAVIGALFADCTASNLEIQLAQNIRDFLD